MATAKKASPKGAAQAARQREPAEAPARAKRRECFVIMPFGTKRAKAAGKQPAATKAKGRDSLWKLVVPAGEDEAAYDIDFNALYRKVIVPAVKAIDGYDINCTRCDEIKYSGWIHEKMIQSIADADIAVVELTTLNPNVFYELGVRHALNKGVTVLIQQENLGQNIPFNLGGMSVVRYDVDDPERAKEEIQQSIAASLARRDHVDSLVFSTLRDLRVSVRRPRPIKETEFLHYRHTGLPEQPPRCIGIVTGDIANVTGIDVWVSSENTEMLMSRHCERAISATVGYLGAKKNTAKAVVEDTIARELAAATEGVACVPAGSVVVTPSGELWETHRAQWVFHAAAVVGQVGQGYTPIPNPATCVVNALAEVEAAAFQARHREAFGEQPVQSIVMPLFGTGQAGRDLEDAAAELFETVIAHFKRNPQGTLQRVYFLAFDDQTREVCTRVLEHWPQLAKEDVCPVPPRP